MVRVSAACRVGRVRTIERVKARTLIMSSYITCLCSGFLLASFGKAWVHKTRLLSPKYENSSAHSDTKFGSTLHLVAVFHAKALLGWGERTQPGVHKIRVRKARYLSQRNWLTPTTAAATCSRGLGEGNLRSRRGSPDSEGARHCPPYLLWRQCRATCIAAVSLTCTL